MSERAKKRKMVKRKCERRMKEQLQIVQIHISRHNEHNNEHWISTNDYGSAVVCYQGVAQVSSTKPNNNQQVHDVWCMVHGKYVW